MRHDEGKTVAKVVAYLCVAGILAPHPPWDRYDRITVVGLMVSAAGSLLWGYRDEIRGWLGRSRADHS